MNKTENKLKHGNKEKIHIMVSFFKNFFEKIKVKVKGLIFI